MEEKYINIGCGDKYHPDWTNIDMVSNGPDVIEHNLLEGIPFPDESFDVVYHSQVLEHFPVDKAPDFIAECYRILKKDGLIRVVVPDLENIVDEYKKYLQQNLENPDAESRANYDWIMLEMYDQTVRNYSGGKMAEYLKKENMVNEKYVLDRIGFVGRSIRGNLLNKGQVKHEGCKNQTGATSALKAILRPVKNAVVSLLSGRSERSPEYQVGKFRMGGEIHQWMYDRYSLGRLLTFAGFHDIRVKDPFHSDIPGFEKYELDVKDGLAFDPTSLFIEARK